MKIRVPNWLYNKKKHAGSQPKPDVAVFAAIVVLGLIIIVSSINVFRIWKDYHDTKELYEETARSYVYVKEDAIAPIKQDKESIDFAVTDIIDVQAEETPWYELAVVDMIGLRELNPDIVGWIYFEDGEISYPVLYSGDNDKYIHTTYMGESAKAGSIFMDGANAKDFSDKHTIIYGHNMRNLTMFGKLKYYKSDKEYYKEHSYFQIITEDKVSRYEIFAFKDVSAYSEIYTICREEDSSYRMLLVQLQKGSYMKSEWEIDLADDVVTLSTCTANDDDRFIVCGVKIAEWEKNENEISNVWR